jgi:RNA polymerase sigma-70 factor, ECF subfamily
MSWVELLRRSVNRPSRRRVEPFVAQVWMCSESPAVAEAPALTLFAADRRRAVARIPPGRRRGVHMVIDADGDLVVRSQRGDRDAFEELVRRHAAGLYAVVLRLLSDRHEAEEVTQETFIRAWRGIAGFKREAQFFTWLYRIGVNEAHRRASRRPPAGVISSLEEDAAEPFDRAQGPHGHAEQTDLRHALERAIRTLEPAYRAPLILRDIEGLSTAQAAAIMGLGEAAFKSRLHRARLAVREAIDDYLPERSA